MSYKLSLIKIPVSNIENSLIFYEKHLNIKNSFYSKEYGWAQFNLDGTQFALYQVGMGGGNRVLGGSVDFHLAIEKSEFDKLSKQWLLSGILDDNRIHRGNDGSTFVDLVDLDRNKLKIFCIKD